MKMLFAFLCFLIAISSAQTDCGLTCCSYKNHVYSEWDDLTDSEQEQYAALGFNDLNFDDGSFLPTACWDQLTTGEQIAAENLCYNELAWNVTPYRKDQCPGSSYQIKGPTTQFPNVKPLIEMPYGTQFDVYAGNSVEANLDETVKNIQIDYPRNFQIVCTKAEDCQKGSTEPSGFFCDLTNQVCSLCPLLKGDDGKPDCSTDHVLPFITSVNKGDCETQCQDYVDASERSCTAASSINACGGDLTVYTTGGGNNGFFCNLFNDDTKNGRCTQCRYINTDMRGQESQCFFTSFENANTGSGCSQLCERYELGNEVYYPVPTGPDSGRYITPGESAVNSINTGGAFCNSSPDPTDFSPGMGKNFCENNYNGNIASLTTTQTDRDLYGSVDDHDSEFTTCQTRRCNSENNRCMLEFFADGTECLAKKINKNNQLVEIAGTCQSGNCVPKPLADCPEGYYSTDAQTWYEPAACVTNQMGPSIENDPQDSYNGPFCQKVDNECYVVPPSQNLLCTSTSQNGGGAYLPNDPTRGGLENANSLAYPAWFDTADRTDPIDFLSYMTVQGAKTQSGSCIIANPYLTEYGDEETTNFLKGADSCLIQGSGSYEYRGMRIIYFEQPEYVDSTNQRDVSNTILYISAVDRNLVPILKCPNGRECWGGFDCDFQVATTGSGFPCQGYYRQCIPEPPASSHGDPIIWTFNHECYDLNLDGKYVATANPLYDHQVNIVVYNDYMREIEVVNTKGDVLLSINVDGTYEAENYPYAFEVFEKECPADMKKTECVDSYMSFRFDAQEFQYFVHILRHDYKDPSLKEGELGYHLDIYPTPYKRFYQKGHKEKYTGLYFENPLPEDLEYCPGGSEKRA